MFDQLAYNLFFYFFALISVVLSVLVVSSTKLLRAAIFLMGMLITVAGFYFLLGLEFMAVIQLLLYVGGIVILIVFAIMLTGDFEAVDYIGSYKKKIASALLCTVFFGVSSFVIKSSSYFEKTIQSKPVGEVREIGLSFLSITEKGFIIPFELISLILLAALVGGIYIGRKENSIEGVE